MKVFNAQEFLRLAAEDRIHWCKVMAIETAKLSAVSESPVLESSFREIANHLDAVAIQLARDNLRTQRQLSLRLGDRSWNLPERRSGPAPAIRASS